MDKIDYFEREFFIYKKKKVLLLSTSDYTLTLSRGRIIDHNEDCIFCAIEAVPTPKRKLPSASRIAERFQFSFFLLFNYEHARMPSAKQPVGFNPNLFSFPWRARRADFARQRRVHSNPACIPNGETSEINSRADFLRRRSRMDAYAKREH